MGEFAGLFGWITVWGFAFEIMNYIIKFVNKKYISKLPHDKKEFADLYRKVMKFIIKYHKPVGVVTIISAIIHLTLMGVFVRIRLSGIIALALMIGLVLLGIYGGFINKNYKGRWLKVHRLIAATVIVAIAVHLLI